jgi:hypothetical protein
MEIYSTTRAKTSLVPAARTASANGTGVDRNDNGLGYQDALVVVHTGTITDGTHTIELQESDDNSSFSAVADANLVGTEPAIVAADDNKTYEIGYRGTKRYLRVIVTAAGTTTGGVYGAVILLANPRVAPVVHS